MKTKTLLSLALAGFVGASLQGSIILSDDFSGYTPGLINGDAGNPQTGSYDNTWTGFTSGGNANFTADGRLQITRPSGSFNGAYSAFIDPAGAAGSGGTVIYFSADLTMNSGVDGAAFGLTMDTKPNNLIGFNASGQAAIWNNVEAGTSNSGNNYSSFVGQEEVSSTSTFAVGTTYTLVGKIADGSSDSVSLWVNPTPGDPESAPLISANVGFDGLFPGNPSIIQFTFLAATNDAGESAFLDNLVIGETWSDVVPVPEPSTFALLFGALALSLVFLRRRR
ncbi:MAG: PEP-CTERM sorting domain-containing protein [Oceanipulchritudo sp.]